jgi:hypothetical protein
MRYAGQVGYGVVGCFNASQFQRLAITVVGAAGRVHAVDYCLLAGVSADDVFDLNACHWVCKVCAAQKAACALGVVKAVAKKTGKRHVLMYWRVTDMNVQATAAIDGASNILQNAANVLNVFPSHLSIWQWWQNDFSVYTGRAVWFDDKAAQSIGAKCINTGWTGRPAVSISIPKVCVILINP